MKMRILFLNKKYITMVFIFALFQVFAAQAQEYVDGQGEATSSAKSASAARREIMGKVAGEAVKNKLIEMVGESKFQSNKSFLNQTFLRQPEKFVPVMNPGSPEILPDGTFKMKVEMKVALASMKEILQKNGLLYENEGGGASILPLIDFQDRTSSQGLRWWIGATSFGENVLSQQRVFDEKMFEAFRQKGLFYIVIDPKNTYARVPQPLRKESLSREDEILMANWNKVQILLKGQVMVSESSKNSKGFLIQFHLQAVQAQNGRAIAELTKQFEVEAGGAGFRAKFTSASKEVAEEMADQVLETWQKGTLGANLLHVTVLEKLKFEDLQKFKSTLVSKVPQIKVLRERRIEPTRLIFEADFSGNLEQFVQKLKAAEAQGFLFRVVEKTPSGVVLSRKIQ